MNDQLNPTAFAALGSDLQKQAFIQKAIDGAWNATAKPIGQQIGRAVGGAGNLVGGAARTAWNGAMAPLNIASGAIGAGLKGFSAGGLGGAAQGAFDGAADAIKNDVKDVTAGVSQAASGAKNLAGGMSQAASRAAVSPFTTTIGAITGYGTNQTPGQGYGIHANPAAASQPKPAVPAAPAAPAVPVPASQFSQIQQQQKMASLTPFAQLGLTKSAFLSSLSSLFPKPPESLTAPSRGTALGGSPAAMAGTASPSTATAPPINFPKPPASLTAPSRGLALGGSPAAMAGTASPSPATATPRPQYARRGGASPSGIAGRASTGASPSAPPEVRNQVAAQHSVPPIMPDQVSPPAVAAPSAPLKPTAEMLAKFRKGTASRYDPKSRLDQEKMRALFQGNKGWAANQGARGAMASGPQTGVIPKAVPVAEPIAKTASAFAQLGAGLNKEAKGIPLNTLRRGAGAAVDAVGGMISKGKKPPLPSARATAPKPQVASVPKPGAPQPSAIARNKTGAPKLPPTQRGTKPPASPQAAAADPFAGFIHGRAPHREPYRDPHVVYKPDGSYSPSPDAPAGHFLTGGTATTPTVAAPRRAKATPTSSKVPPPKQTGKLAPLAFDGELGGYAGETIAKPGLMDRISARYGGLSDESKSLAKGTAVAGAAGAGMFGANRMGQASGREEGVGEGVDAGFEAGLQQANANMDRGGIFGFGQGGINNGAAYGAMANDRSNLINAILGRAAA